MGSLHFLWSSTAICGTCRKEIRDGLLIGGVNYHQWCVPATSGLKLLTEDDVERIIKGLKVSGV